MPVVERGTRGVKWRHNRQKGEGVMSQEQYAFIHKSRVPAVQEWQRAVDEAGYDLRIDAEFKPFEHAGFLPCQLNGEQSGVEVYYDLTRDLCDQELAQSIAQGRDVCISFRWGGSFREGACAMILALALAKSFDAILSYEGEPPCDSLDAFQAELAIMLKEAERERNEEE